MNSINYYALEPILIERLAVQCPSIGLIEGAPDLYAIRELSQAANAATNPHHPITNTKGQKHGAAYVIFWGDEVKESKPDGCARASQTWLIAVCAKKHQKMPTGVAARQEDGALVDQVINALRGWDYGNALAAAISPTLAAPVLSQGRRRLRRVTCPVNRHQMIDPLGQDNGLVTTLLAYEADNIIF